MDASSARNLSEYGWRPANGADRRGELERALDHWFDSLKRAADSNKASSSAAARVAFWKALVDSWHKHAVVANDYTFPNTSLPPSVGDTGDEWNATIRLYRKRAELLHTAQESGPLVTLVRYGRTREFPWVTWQLWVRVVHPPTQAHREMPTKLTGQARSSQDWTHAEVPLTELTPSSLQVEPPTGVAPAPVQNAERASVWPTELSLVPIEKPRVSRQPSFEELTLVPIEPRSGVSRNATLERDPESPGAGQLSQTGREPQPETIAQAADRSGPAWVHPELAMAFQRMDAQRHASANRPLRRMSFMDTGMGAGWFGSLLPHLSLWFFLFFGFSWMQRTFIGSSLLIRWLSAVYEALAFPLVRM